ncbi:UNVERIFIED_CONTAM: hypothetical protein Sangu_0510800 [Sesamum angustifolium]|uniref:Late embryogenesis abundant protein LEA-2 subgroup domain-containing protein n=1 Tax=Sesamum angustifolium TaxID=2727405 RepID=A0AAW2Q8N2_9LAMI
MDENEPPQRIRGPDRYNRLTTLEMENQGNASSTGGESDCASEFRQFCFDLHQQLESACHVIDWDRIFMIAFVTIAIVLVVFAFFPYLRIQLMSDQRLQHQFILNSLTISDFHAASDQVTGKCDVMFNISNQGDRSIYHETSVLSIFLDHELLWVARTGDFFVDIGNDIVFNVSINKTTVSVPASFVPTAFVESRTLHKPLRFKLKYDGMLREGLAAWYEERAHIYIICGWVDMQFVNETTLEGGPANCSVIN